MIWSPRQVLNHQMNVKHGRQTKKNTRHRVHRLGGDDVEGASLFVLLGIVEVRRIGGDWWGDYFREASAW